MLSSKCAVFSSKKSKFLKELVANALLSSLGVKTPLHNFPLSGKILF